MQQKICLINQPAGFGDVLFLQKVVKLYIKKGYKIIFPLNPQLIVIKDHIKIEGLEFVNINDNFIGKNYLNNFNIVNQENFIYLPLCYADRIISGSVLEAKYKLINEDYSDWANYLEFERNIEKENKLYYDVLGLKDGEEFILINKKYGTQPNYNTKEVYIENKDKKIIEVDFFEGYSIFDWCKTMENALEISIIDSSMNYIIEKLNLKAKVLNLTSRFTPANFMHIQNIFKKDWKYNY